MATKKAGTAGRFGARYGKTLRVKLATIEQQQRQKHQCPDCKKYQVKRVSLGIYECNHCDVKFTGRAYVPY
ncbi:MAG: 50S ribosomal protein L37ae [Nanoarchaeota archaeon]